MHLGWSIAATRSAFAGVGGQLLAARLAIRYSAGIEWFGQVAVATLIIDLFHYKHLQTILKLHKKTLFFLLPFIFGLWWLHLVYSLELGLTLTYASVLLVILFFLLNKTESDISKSKSIDAAHNYNSRIAASIVEAFADEANRTHQFMSTPYIVDIYRDHIDYIYQTKGNTTGDAMIKLIAALEKSNSLIKITQQMQIQGIQDQPGRSFLGKSNTTLHENALKILQ